MSGLLAGKVVLVTAAAGTGIGFATARRAVEEGAIVAISDRHERRIGEAAEALEPVLGRRPLALVCDVTDQRQVDAQTAAVLAAHGRIDALVNNAGLGGTADLVDMTDEAWSRVLDVTLTGTMRVMRSVLPAMIRQGSGAIVNNASATTPRPRRG
jgi:3-oxoacyl-[acyl-carrier protein] reductase